LGVSTLQASLIAQGVSAKISYLNFAFAERIGVEFNEFIAENFATSLLTGEWMFAAALDPERNPELDEAYLAWLSEYASKEHFEKIVATRRIATGFADEAAAELVAMKPRILGFSTTFAQNCASLAIAARVRALDPDILICFGGANCEGSMGQALCETYEQIDYVFSGEADHTFPLFVRRFLDGEQPYATDPSIFSRTRANEPVGAKPIIDLDQLPIPEFSDYFEQLRQASFREQVQPGLLFESSRGCWWGAKKHCRFCGLNGTTMEYRSKSAGRTLEELDYLSEKWGITRFEAADNILNMKHVKTVLGVLGERGMPYRLFYEIKSNLNSDQLEMIARGGVTWVQPGIESLSDEVLELMEKGVSGLKNVRLLRNCAEFGIRCNWNMLQGFPGEKEWHYRQMLDLLPALEHLDPPSGLSTVRVDRFSPYYNRAAELGFENVRPGRAYRYVYDLPDEVLDRLAYFFNAEMVEIDAGGRYAEEMRAALLAWRNAVYDSPNPAELKLLRLGPLNLVVDTRSCAAVRHRFLERAEDVVLTAFRNPVPIEQHVTALAAAENGGVDVRAVFERLTAWRYIVVDRDYAVSVVVDAANRIHTDEDYRNFPGGMLRENHPIAAAAPAMDEMGAE
jgi:magnesium-protoporphyrin IX monomethyl ester (oxidative) cyclase